MNDGKRVDTNETNQSNRVGRVNLPVESQLVIEPQAIIQPQAVDEPQAVREPVDSPQSRWSWSAGDLLFGLVAILVMIGATLVILQGVFQIMPNSVIGN